jgi:hypothetical protein
VAFDPVTHRLISGGFCAAQPPPFLVGPPR